MLHIYKEILKYDVLDPIDRIVLYNLIFATQDYALISAFHQREAASFYEHILFSIDQIETSQEEATK